MIFLECIGSRACLSAELQRQKDSKYDKSRKTLILRDFLFLFSDIYQ